MNPNLVLTTSQKKIRFKRCIRKHQLAQKLECLEEEADDYDTVNDVGLPDEMQQRSEKNDCLPDRFRMQLSDWRRGNLTEPFFQLAPPSDTKNNDFFRPAEGK